MKHTILLFLLFAISVTWESTAVAQVKASFTASQTSGCPGLSVQFTSTSTCSTCPPNTLTYFWDFGNGNTSCCNLNIASAIYNSPGTFTVKLRVSDGTLKDSTTMAITVFQPPVAAFTANPTKGCTSTSAPFTVVFTDQSTGSINNWEWIIGGNKVTSQNPTYYFYPVAYPLLGEKYDVSLKVTDIHTCTSTIQKTELIDVANYPNASFTADPQNSCKNPETVYFTNYSGGLGTLSYVWNFQGGVGSATSTLKDPTRVYNVFQSKGYAVKLTVYSDYGCNNYVEDSIYLFEVKAIGTLTQGGTTITNGAYVCADVPVTFSSQSTGNPSVAWDFGDGTPLDEDLNPQHTYTTAGNYTVKLIATGINCSSTATWSFTIEKVTAGFTSNPPAQSCSSPVNVQFTSTSTTSASIISYLWTFYDASTSNSPNTTSKFIYASADADEYVIHHPESFLTTLEVTSTHGCTSSAFKTFIISRPTALFAVDTAVGCAGRTVTFTSKSQNEASYYWDFGDGTTFTSPTYYKAKKYDNPGIYQTRLVITNSLGCKDTSYYIPVKVGKVPSPSFSLTPSTVCSSDLVSITNTTPTGDNVDYWEFTINGQPIDACPGEKNPTFKVKSAVGDLTVKLIAGNNGCYAETTMLIHNNGPKSSFSYNIADCATNPQNYTFTGSTTGSVIQWEFGDGGTSTALNPTYKYTAVKDSNYTVKFITSDGGSCSDTVIQIVRARQPNPQFTLPSPAEGCANQSISFNGTGSHKKTDFCSDKFIWNFKDNTPQIRTDQNITNHIFSTRGWYKVLMTAIYDNGCTDTVSHSIRIYQPYAGLIADKTQGCSGLQVKFTDTSEPDDNPLDSLILSYGDLSPDSITTEQHHKFQTHEYDNPGTYLAILTAIDSKRCTDTAGLKIKIGQPDAYFTATPTNICVNDSITFIPDFLEGDSAIWNFGDGTSHSTSQVTMMIHKYTDLQDTLPFQLQDFPVKLKIYQYSCPDSSTNHVKVLKADATFTLSDSVLDCPPQNITFTHRYPSSVIASGEWSVGWPEKKYSYRDSLTYTYMNAGEDTVHLSITTKSPLSCKASYSRIIKIKGPVGYYYINPDSACKNDEITFTLYGTKDVSGFEWDFGDGIVSSDTSLVQKHRYSSVGKKIVTLLLHSGICPKPSQLYDTIHIAEVIAKFSVIDTSVCEHIPIAFTDSSSGNNEQKWNFGDGTTSSEISPVHPFGIGTFPVVLTISNATGCKDTATKVLTVHVNPTITVSLDKSKCPENIMLLNATGGNRVAWYPGNGLNDSTIYNPEATPKFSTYYKAKVSYDSTGCYKIDSLFVTRANVRLYPTDTTVVIGDTLPIYFIDSSYVKSYIWVPPTYLSCTNCLNPIASPSADIVYNLILAEPNGCFSDTVKVKIKVDWTKLDFDVPDAFKPGTDEINSVLKVRGRGIRELLEFKIYNRWGNLIFSSTDVKDGWDGKYQGKDQPIDTYIWTVTVKNYSDQIIKKKGTVLLMR